MCKICTSEFAHSLLATLNSVCDELDFIYIIMSLAYESLWFIS